MNELALLFATDPVRYSDHIRSVIVMKAEAEVAKMLITATTWEYRLMALQEFYRLDRKRAKDEQHR